MSRLDIQFIPLVIDLLVEVSPLFEAIMESGDKEIILLTGVAVGALAVVAYNGIRKSLDKDSNK